MYMLPNPNQGGNDNRNLILAILLALVVFLGYDYYKLQQHPAAPQAAQQAEQAAATPATTHTADVVAPQPLPHQAEQVDIVKPTLAVKKQTGTGVQLSNPHYTGTVSTQGGRLTQLSLKDLKLDAHPEGDNWFGTTGTIPQYLDAGWLGTGVLTPAPNAVWQPVGKTDNEARLVWSNNQGQLFERVITFHDEAYLVTLTDRVTNQLDVPISLQHYAQVVRGGTHFENEHPNWMNYFGPLGLIDGELVESSYDDVDEATFTREGFGGWWGMSTQYFLTAIGAPAEEETVRRFSHTKRNGQDLYTAVVQRHAITVEAQQTAEVVTDVYVGPKSIAALSGVGYGFERAVDYGWFSALSEPMYHTLKWLHAHLGNWGLAIIGLTVILKIITFPLTYKSFASMAKLKQLQPKMKEMQEKYKDDREQMATAMMKLYKEEKVSPLSGCWPMLVQMPIFFAMYKMMLVSFEFRGAPFYGWVTDLSLQDPYFVLPLLMGASMFVQMQLNPQAGDPIQQQVMKYMPVVFTVFFLFFPSGLVLYWLTNNLISIAQQWWMLKRAGVR